MKDKRDLIYSLKTLPVTPDLLKSIPMVDESISSIITPRLVHDAAERRE